MEVPVTAETGPAAEIAALEAELRATTVANSPVATDRLLALDWPNGDAEGRVVGKAQLLATLGQFRFLGIEDAEVGVRARPGVAVVSGRSVRRRAAPDGGERVRRGARAGGTVHPRVSSAGGALAGARRAPCVRAAPDRARGAPASPLRRSRAGLAPGGQQGIDRAVERPGGDGDDEGDRRRAAQLGERGDEHVPRWSSPVLWRDVAPRAGRGRR
jgi:hypothetical protein